MTPAFAEPARQRACRPSDHDSSPSLGGSSSLLAQFTALRYFALDGTDHHSHHEQASLIRRYIGWRNRHVTDPRLRKVVKRAATIKRAKHAEELLRDEAPYLSDL